MNKSKQTIPYRNCGFEIEKSQKRCILHKNRNIWCIFSFVIFASAVIQQIRFPARFETNFICVRIIEKEVFMDSARYSFEAAKLTAPSPERAKERRHQGIPGVECVGKRLFVCCYANNIPGEGPGNYAILRKSDDKGCSFEDILDVLPPDENSRVFDPVIWLDPENRLWFFWAQSRSSELTDVFDGRAGVWAAVCDNPLAEKLQWNAPRRLGDGVMMNKPVVLNDGSWALPAALWASYPDKLTPEQHDMARSNILLSRDQGKTFELIIGPDVPDREFDEHVIIQQQDGSLRILVRTRYGIGESTGTSAGTDWTPGKDSDLPGPASRFALRRLKSGKLCLISHQTPCRLPGEKLAAPFSREKLTAWLSDDDGKTWYGRLMLDPGSNVSYPDFAESDDGFIYAVYDHERLSEGQIRLARFTEEEAAAGRLFKSGSYLQMTVAAMERS